MRVAVAVGARSPLAAACCSPAAVDRTRRDGRTAARSRRGRSARAPTSPGADLEDADLSRADLSGANLDGTNLSGADLSEAEPPSGAQIVDADLSGCRPHERQPDGRDDLRHEPRRRDALRHDPHGRNDRRHGLPRLDRVRPRRPSDDQASEAEVTSFDVGDLKCGARDDRAGGGDVGDGERNRGRDRRGHGVSPRDSVRAGRRTSSFPATASRTRSRSRRRATPAPGVPETKEVSSELAALAADVDAAAAERVDPPPAAGDVEQLEVADARRESGVDDEVVADCGSSPSIVRSRSSGVPVDQACGLHAVGYCTGYFVCARAIAAERLRQAAVEELGGIEDARGDLRRLLLEAVAAKAPGDERVVERPDRADVVADRVVAPLALGERANAPAGEEPSARADGARPPSPSTCRRCRSTAGGRCSRRARRPCRPSGSSASAKYSPSSTQKSRLKRRLRSAASARAGRRARRPSRSRARAARRAPSRRTRSPGARTSRAGSREARRRGTRSSPTSPSSTGSRARSPRCGGGTRCSRCPGGPRTRRSS